MLAGTANKAAVTGTLVPGLESLGVDMGSTALLNTATNGDTTAAQAQLDGFIARWKTEGVDAVFATGDEVVSKQFIAKLREEMPDVMLLTDTATALIAAREEKQAGTDPNPYEGFVSAQGPTASEYERSANWKRCAEIYRAQTGK